MVAVDPSEPEPRRDETPDEEVRQRVRWMDRASRTLDVLLRDSAQLNKPAA